MRSASRQKTQRRNGQACSLQCAQLPIAAVMEYAQRDACTDPVQASLVVSNEKSNQLRYSLFQHFCQLCMAVAGEVHEVHLIELAVLCVEKVHALPLADDAELLCHTGRFFHTAITHHSVVEACADGPYYI